MPDQLTGASAGAENDEQISGLRHTFRALSHRNFRLFFVGQTISWIGTWMQQIALGWLAYRLTNSPFMLGLVTFASQAPTFVLSPFTGALADHFNRRKLVIVTQSMAMLQALGLAWLTLSAHIQIWQIIAFGVFLGIVNAVDMPARQSFLVQMVDDKNDLPNAIALNSSLVNAARLVGPTIAGFLISWVGEGMCFLLNGVSYLAVITALVLMKVAPLSYSERRQTDVLSHLTEGWSYAFRTGPIRGLLILLAAVNLFGATYTVLMPVFARDIYHGTANTLGLLMGASGVGALAGAVFLASRKSVVGLGKWVLVSTCIFGATLAMFGFSRNLVLGMILLVFAGFGMMVQTAATNTVLQTITDEDKRGRVMSLFTMAFMITPFGGLAAGVAANHIGTPLTICVLGILTLISGLLFAAQLPRLRREARPIYMRKNILPGEPKQPGKD